jgi:hypothetical protein
MSNLPFDPSLFLQATVTEVSEKRPPLPIENPASEDGLYVATIGEIKPPKTGTIEKGERTGQPWVQVLIPLKIDVPAQLREALKLPPTLTFTDGIFLDLTPDFKGLDTTPGKNRGMRLYREAADMNKPGDTFSWSALQGKMVKVQIAHKQYNGDTLEEIKGVFDPNKLVVR